jgi:hypothetical protein
VETCLQCREHGAGNAVIDDGCQNVIKVSESRIVCYLGSRHVAVWQLGRVGPSGAEEPWRLGISIIRGSLSHDSEKEATER